MKIKDLQLIGNLTHQIDIIEDKLFGAQNQLKRLREDYTSIVNIIIKENRE